MADDPIATLARLREEMTEALNAVLPGLDPVKSFTLGVVHGNALKELAALEAVLNLHAPRTDRVLGSSCFTHRNSLNTMLPVPGCEDCVQDRQREVCPECRDEFGDPVLLQDCRAREAIARALAGKDADGG